MPEDWLTRWEEGRIGWHEAEGKLQKTVEPGEEAGTGALAITLTACKGEDSATLRFRCPALGMEAERSLDFFHWTSILPPFLAILLALLLQRTILALFCGVWLGATLLEGLNPLAGLVRFAERYLYEQALRDLHEQLARDYPCFALKGIDWQAVGERLVPRAQEAKNDDEFGLLCLEMVAALEDSHATLLPAAAQVPQVDFPQWDAGFACLVDDRGEPVVYYVAEGSSAATAGLQIGMTVRELNGVAALEAIAVSKSRSPGRKIPLRTRLST